MPRVKKSIISTDNLDTAISMGSTPPELRDAGIEISDIQVVPAHHLRTKAAEAKFMEEKVVIEIEAGDGPNDPVFVHAGHNGVAQYIKRGVDQIVKRKYLYSLLAANTVKFAGSFGRDGTGNEYNRLTPSGQRTHRVRLVSDNNPEGGMKWVQKVAASLSASGITV